MYFTEKEAEKILKYFKEYDITPRSIDRLKQTNVVTVVNRYTVGIIKLDSGEYAVYRQVIQGADSKQPTLSDALARAELLLNLNDLKGFKE